jgi:hypothetical protein
LGRTRLRQLLPDFGQECCASPFGDDDKPVRSRHQLIEQVEFVGDRHRLER